MPFDPSIDQPFQGPIPTPDFAEAQQWNFTDGRHGVVYHVGSMPGDLKLWHNAFAITCPDGSVLATKVVGRSATDRFGAHSVNSQTMVPYAAWRIRFDGGLRRYRPDALQVGPGTDGLHVPVRVELDISANHPVWEPGARSGDATDSVFHTICRMHHEQAVKARGVICIDGEHVDFNGIGHRDHSFGPRDFGKLLTGFWVNATFASGWAFLAFEGMLEGVENVRRGAIFENGEIIECEALHSADLETTAPEPRQFAMTLRTLDGRERLIEVTCRGGVNWTGAGPTEWCVGTDLSDPRNYVFTHYFADFACGGEMGLGFVDRGAQAARLRWPLSGEV